LVGNKLDLNEKRQVAKEEAQSYAKEKQFIFQEVSAKTGINVNTLFYKDILERISKQYHYDANNIEEQVQSKFILYLYYFKLNLFILIIIIII
jgi:GTPase SAR1 family protein